MLTPIPVDTSPVDYYMPSSCDIETGRKGELLAVSLYVSGEYEVYFTWEDWLNRIIKLSKKDKQARRIWAHNGAGFDWLHLSEYCEKERKDIGIQMVMSGSSGVSVTLTIPGLRYKIRLQDSYRLLPQSLAKLSKDMGVETPKLDLEGVHPEDLYHTNPELFHQYLKHDTIAVSEILLKFWHTVNEVICITNPARELKGTVASMAMYIFRLEFLKTVIRVPWTKFVKEIERKTYHGGLVLAPNHGIYEDCTGIDVNSSFASIMATINLPADCLVTSVDKYHPGKLGMYYIDYRTDDETFPYIYDETGKLSTAGRAWVTSLELEDIFNHGTARVIRGIVYQKTAPLLKEYAERIFKLKSDSKKSNPAIYMVSKLLLNALYGKFAQSEIGTKLVSADTPGMLDRVNKAIENRRGGNPREIIRLLGRYYQVETPMRSEYTFVGIASMITAGARLKLINAVRANRERALYTDTDSLIVTGDITGLPIGSGLGEWSIEFTQCEFNLMGRKIYGVVDKNGNVLKIRMKGISLKKIKDKTEFNDYQMEIIRKMQLCISDINHSEVFSFSSPPTAHDVLILRKKAAVWMEKYRTVRVTSDAAQRERLMEKAPLFTVPREENGLFKLVQVIRSEIGGIAAYKNNYSRGEYASIPLYLKNKNGMTPDRTAEYLAVNYPYLGVHNEADLYDRLTEKSLQDYNQH